MRNKIPQINKVIISAEMSAKTKHARAQEEVTRAEVTINRLLCQMNECQHREGEEWKKR